jgi:uncharacterized membrane protein YvbJ
MKICPRCIHENPDDARYCEKCGYKFRRVRKAIVIITVVLLIAAGAVIFFSPPSQSPQPPTPISPTPVVEPAPVPVVPVPVTGSFADKSPAPENGVKKCIIEIRKAGLAAFIINIDSQKRWRLVKADFDSSLVQSDHVKDKMDISLNDYIGSIVNYGPTKNNISFIASADTQYDTKMQTIINEIMGLGYSIYRFDSETEIRWGFKSTVPERYAKSSFYVKISSDKTVIAWLEDATIRFHVATVGNANKVGELVKHVPTNNRGYCFIVGDVPAKMAQQHRNVNERFTVLSKPDDYNFTGKQEQIDIKTYRDIRDASGCNTFIFDWETNFVVGKLLDD